MLLRRALVSLARQTDASFQVVVGDDGSLVPVQPLIKAFASRLDSLEVIRSTESIGAPRMRNRLIEAADGNVILTLDDDDYFMANRIETIRAAIGQADIVKDSIVLRTSYGSLSERLTKERVSFDRLRRGSFVTGANIAIRRDLVRDIRGFDPALPAMQDLDLIFRATQLAGYVDILSDPLYVADVSHESGRISTSQRATEAARRIIEKHDCVLTSRAKQSLRYRAAITDHGRGSILASAVRYGPLAAGRYLYERARARVSRKLIEDPLYDWETVRSEPPAVNI